MKDWSAIKDRVMKQAEKRNLRLWAIKPKLTKHVVRRRHKVVDTVTDREVLETFAKRHTLTDATLATGVKLL
jgi:hypothetical protein